jgi:hypothetical protein
MAPSLAQTLAVDMACGVWTTPTQTFWETTARDVAGMPLTPGRTQSLQHEVRRGQWTSSTMRLLQAVFPTATPSVMRTLQQDFRQGRWSSLTQRMMEEL